MTVASAPASSANLGPGFDVLALALDLRCRVTANPAGTWAVTSGDGPVSDGTREMVVAVLGPRPHEVVIESAIPQAAGLGSSAALLVATAAAAWGTEDPEALVARAGVVEGHFDNVAAAVHGGLVAVAPDRTIARLVVHPSLHVVVAVPDETLPTAEARRVLPATVDRAVAARTAARMVMLIEGLRAADEPLLAAARGDEMHEAPRAALSGTPARLIDAATGAGAAFAAWSGAGPSVVAFVGADGVDAVIDALAAELGTGGRAFEAGIDRDGVRLE